MENYQKILFPYAYNILGSCEDAKDVVQDTILKYLSIKKSNHIENKTGYLIKSVINNAINTKKKNNRTVTDPLWLPEPVATENADKNLVAQEILSYSLLVLLEKLPPKERAVFILKEAFDYAHKEIALILDLNIENSRKLLSRAKTKLSNFKTIPKKESLKNNSTYMNNYIHIIKNGDTNALKNILSDEISLSADGGKNIKVVRELTIGKSPTSNLLLYVFKTYQKTSKIKIKEINHQPALLFYDKEKLINCQVFDIQNNKITNIYAIVDPNKLNLI